MTYDARHVTAVSEILRERLPNLSLSETIWLCTTILRALRRVETEAPPDVFGDVRDFHEIIVGGQISATPSFPTSSIARLRQRLVSEEYTEFMSALVHEDFAGMLDGACDLLVVVLGTLLAYGLPFNEAWREVHRSNMAKEGGPIRDDGKVLKPEGWTPPDIARVIRDAMLRR